LAFERGEGARLFSTDGEVYLDCMAGIATNALGHAHPRLVNAVKTQAEKLWHVSNIFRIPEQEKLADRLTAETFADVVFFTNSGTEAIECALKLARKYHSAKGNPERIDIITFEGAFHGRSYAAVNAGGNPNYTDGFGPRLPGYIHLPFGDHEALKAAIGPTTAAIMIEPVQGEGGARAVPDVCLRGLRELCDREGILLIYDEVQCGLGRTGKLFAYEWSGAAPDVMAVAKALGSGFPVGACLATRDAAAGMVVGAHGSTFGGNPLAMVVAYEAVDEIAKPQTLDNVREVAGYFTQQLNGLKDQYPDIIVDVRGRGLLIGIKLIPNNRDFMVLARDQKLLVAGGGDNCVRLLPPLTLTIEEAQEAVAKIGQACEVARQHAKAKA
jgi:acetylornithine/N-succinyldiaminopimelate aminotransferase